MQGSIVRASRARLARGKRRDDGTLNINIATRVRDYPCDSHVEFTIYHKYAVMKPRDTPATTILGFSLQALSVSERSHFMDPTLRPSLDVTKTAFPGILEILKL